MKSLRSIHGTRSLVGASLLLLVGCDTGRSILGGTPGADAAQEAAATDVLVASPDVSLPEASLPDVVAAETTPADVPVSEVACMAPLRQCGANCVDLLTDRNNCGMCSRACAPSQNCTNGVCVGTGLLQLTLTWDRPGDLDFHVLTPSGVEVFYGNRNECEEDRLSPLPPVMTTMCTAETGVDAATDATAGSDGASPDVAAMDAATNDASADAATEVATDTSADVAVESAFPDARIGGVRSATRCTGLPGYASVDGGSFGARLDTDDTRCTGPENIFWTSPPAPGSYVLCVVPFGIAATTRFRLQIRRPGMPDMEFTGERQRGGSTTCGEGTGAYVTTLNIP